jgi:hypothetical protein
MVKIKAIILSLISIFFGQGYAANLNPVTVEQVHAIVSDLATYTAGLGVKIVNNVVSQTPFLSIGDFYQGGGWCIKSVVHVIFCFFFKE